MTQKRTIVVSDIHGCFEEFQELLEKCERRPEDEIISLGDLVDRGPDPVSVVKFFKNDPNASSILGNHEERHIRIYDKQGRSNNHHRITEIMMGTFYPETIEYFRTLPLYLERHGHLLVHCCLESDKNINDQHPNILLRGTKPHRSIPYLLSKIIPGYSPPGFKRVSWQNYTGTTPVIYGHYANKEILNDPQHTWGIDTGGVFGHKLTALILPEFKIVQVNVNADHWSKIKAEYKTIV